MQERVTLRNESPERLEVEVALEAEADFADIISVKLHDFSLGDPELAQPLPPPAPTTYDEGRSQVSIVDPRGDLGTRLVFTKPGRLDGNAMTFSLTLESHESWDVSVDVRPWLEEDLETFDQLDDERETVGDVVAAWTLRVPRVRGGWESLRRAFDRSIADLAALRMRTGEYRRPLFAAGMPWFMTVFGRDTAITSLQTLLLGPEIAVGALDALTELQAQVEDPTIDAEPGKIVHEVREGRCAETWFPRYYGSIDSTPLYLVLLAETWRWTDDASFAQRMREPALLALEWIDRYGDRDGDGFVEYSRRSTAASRTSRGRTPATRSAFRTARSPRLRSRRSRCRGTSTTRSAGSPTSRARSGATRLSPTASTAKLTSCGSASTRRSGSTSAAASTRSRSTGRSGAWTRARRTWATSSGAGSCLRRRSARIVDQLLSEELWTGWGIRTMASDAAAFNPISYHNGTVWPHDTALAAWGLARHGHVAEARRIGRALIEAAAHFDWSLPEVFAGYARDETPVPHRVSDRCAPQAWAAGTPILLVRVLLGLEPDRERQRLVSAVTDELPSWLDGLRIEGVRAYGRTWTVAVERGHVTIAEGV